MVSLKNTLLASCIILAGAAGAARADVYHVDVYSGDIGQGFDAVAGSASLFTAANNSQHATFTYTGTLNFSDTAAQNSTPAGDLNSSFFGSDASGISNYVDLTAPLSADYGNFATLGSFLASSGSVAGYGYDSLYIIQSETPAAGGTNLTITHDDGVGVYANQALQPGTTTGPTTAVTETITLPANDQYSIDYARENGTPSVLQVAVPEPMSLTLMGVGLLALSLVRRRRRA